MEQSPSLNDCLKLLKGEKDEQRLAGLLLVTKFVKGDDFSSILRVYKAVGIQFLDRLLKTGMGKEGENRDMYLQLSITVLSAFCRVSEIATSNEMVSKIPLILEVLSKGLCLPVVVVDECYEFLFIVSKSSEAGVVKLYESGGMEVLASQMSTLPDGSHSLELAIELVKLTTTKLSLGKINNEYPMQLATMVAAIARQFAILHNALKLELLELLSAILSSKDSERVRDALRLMSSNNWPTYMRVGVIAVLQDRVGPTQKLHALILAESIISISGQGWLIDQVTISDIQGPIPADRCLLLVLESSRVEIAVLLNEIAYLKYEASKTSSTSETISEKQQNLAIVFSLVEKIINLISSIWENEETVMNEITFSKVISQLNETISVVLEYLQDAKEHKQKKGSDLLAAVRVIGSYLAETPHACREKVGELLGYMLSVEGEDEASPFYSISFLLPMLCQITMDINGCKSLVSCGGHVTVLEYLTGLIRTNSLKAEDSSSIYLACDTIMNVLLKGEQRQVRIILDESTIVQLLSALAYWADNTDESSVTMMASSICTLVLDYTSEAALLNHADFNRSIYSSLTRIILRSLAKFGQVISDEAKEDSDLFEIITSGYSRWSGRYPQIKDAVER